MPRPLPRHRRHATGQGVVTLSGHDHYTGAYDSPEATRKYDELIARWLAGGRRPLHRDDGRMTVARLAERYRRRAEAEYRKRGKLTSYAKMIGRVVDALASQYGSMDATDFDRAEFRAFRESWLNRANAFGRPYARVTINEYAETVRRLFLWGAGEGLLPLADWMDRRVIGRLRKGRSAAREVPPVGPAPLADVGRVIEAAPAHVAAMIRVQFLTGMRPGEVCGMRPADLDRSGDLWVYNVAGDHNKTEHLDRPRAVRIGPRAQAILGPWLARSKGPEDPVFRTMRGNVYRPAAYATVVGDICRRIGVAPWTPNQLRHNRATEVRRLYGLEAAQVSLGHSRADVTQIYAERDVALVEKVTRETG